MYSHHPVCICIGDVSDGEDHIRLSTMCTDSTVWPDDLTITSTGQKLSIVLSTDDATEKLGFLLKYSGRFPQQHKYAPLALTTSRTLHLARSMTEAVLKAVRYYLDMLS